MPLFKVPQTVRRVPPDRTTLTLLTYRQLSLTPIPSMTGALGALPFELLAQVIESFDPKDEKLSLLCFILTCRTTLHVYNKLKIEMRLPKPGSLNCLFVLKSISPRGGLEHPWMLCYFCSKFIRKNTASEERVITIQEREERHARLVTISDFYWGWAHSFQLGDVTASTLCCYECHDLRRNPVKAKTDVSCPRPHPLGLMTADYD